MLRPCVKKHREGGMDAALGVTQGYLWCLCLLYLCFAANHAAMISVIHLRFIGGTITVWSFFGWLVSHRQHVDSFACGVIGEDCQSRESPKAKMRGSLLLLPKINITSPETIITLLFSLSSLSSAPASSSSVSSFLYHHHHFQFSSVLSSASSSAQFLYRKDQVEVSEMGHALSWS